MSTIETSSLETQPPRWHRSPRVLDAARRWKLQCFLTDGSVFTDERLWALENLLHLKRGFVDRPDLGDRDFFAKLADQLRDLPPPAVRLTAEFLWLLYLPISEEAMQGATKLRQIQKVWEWSEQPLPEAQEFLGEVLDEGIAKPGTAYATHRWRELAFAILLTIAWKALPDTRRAALIESPWDFAAWLDAIPSSSSRQFRHMLQPLLHEYWFDQRDRVAEQVERLLR
jgi:5-methylcytosine-specific restriction enzyme B